MHWGDQWCSTKEPSVKLIHDNCGSLLTHSVKCNTCEIDVRANEIRSLDKSNEPKMKIGASNES